MNKENKTFESAGDALDFANKKAGETRAVVRVQVAHKHFELVDGGRVMSWGEARKLEKELDATGKFRRVTVHGWHLR